MSNRTDSYDLPNPWPSGGCYEKGFSEGTWLSLRGDPVPFEGLSFKKEKQQECRDLFERRTP